MIVAGILSFGTLAPGEYVAKPEHLKKLDEIAPRKWEPKNLQEVIGTGVIRGSSGPPHFW